MRSYSSWRGLKALVHDAVSATTNLVGEGHDSTGRTVERVASLTSMGAPVRRANRLRAAATHGVLATVRGVNRAVEAVSDGALDYGIGRPVEEDVPVTLRSDAMGSGAWVADALIGAVNGVVGDHLHRRGNALGLGMSLRHGDTVLTPESLRAMAPPYRQGRGVGQGVGRKIAVWVHGLATTEWSWCLDAARFLGDPAATFGSLLERDHGFVPVYARYNTGRRIPDNGAELCAQLEMLVAGWPGGVHELVLVGHSMGGLVIRSAVPIASVQGARWLPLLRRVVCLGSPHQGAALERLGVAVVDALHAVDLPGTRIPAAILRARSAGIQDLGQGVIADRIPVEGSRDSPKADTVEIPVPSSVAWAFIAGSLTEDPSHPLSQVFGDLLVRVPSAEGPVNSTFPVQTARFGGVRHHELQVHPDVYEQVRRFCAGEWDRPRAQLGDSA